MTTEQLEVDELQYRLKRAKQNPIKYIEDFLLWCELELLKIEALRKELKGV
jgi:hypothetical protein